MLQKIAQLSTEIEGRYASNAELEDLERYIASIDQRISAYEKISQQSEKIIGTVIERTMAKKNLMLTNQNEQLTLKCQADLRIVLRSCSAAMLIDDLDRLREGFLLWLQTIVKAFKCTRYTQVEYQILQEVIRTILTLEEMVLMSPSLQLSHTLLGS